MHQNMLPTETIDFRRRKPHTTEGNISVGLPRGETMRIHWLVDPEIVDKITPRLIILGKFLPANDNIDRAILSHNTVQARRPRSVGTIGQTTEYGDRVTHPP